MPPPPELGGGFGDIGIVEVLRQAEAEHPAQADGHVRVAGEVKIQLECVGDGAQPGQAHRQPVPGGKGAIGDLPKGVRQQDLFRQAETEAGGALGRTGGGLPPVRQGRAEVVPAQDGTLQKLGEEGHEQHHPAKAPFRRNGAPVHIGQVGDGLEGEEGDAGGQGDGGNGHIHSQSLQVVQQEAGVLEVAQHPDIQDQRRRENDFPVLSPRGRQQGGAPVQHAGGQQHRQQPEAAPGVKHQTEHQQDEIPSAPEPGGYQKIAEQAERQKGEQKRHAAEGHGITSLS